MSESAKFIRPANFFIALVIFALVNILCSIPHVLLASKVIKEENGVRPCIESAVLEFRHEPANIVTMGSSLMMSAMWSCDFAKSNQIPDFFHHHHALVFQQTLESAGITPAHVFSFAIPGEMVSDAYLICDKLFVAPHKPDLIIYGVAPRDFVDDLLSSETRTPVFETLSDLSDVNKMSDLYVSSFSEKIDFVLSHTIFLYGSRVHDQKKFAELCTKIINPILIGSARDDTVSAENSGISLFGDRKLLWARSIDEYSKRYNHFNHAQWNKQNNFLRALLKTAQDRKITVVLLKMPLTATNLSLMPSGFYAQYSNNLSTIAKEFSVPIFDPGKETVFDDSLFYDTVHLNATGGNKLILLLTHWLSNNSIYK